MTDMTRWLFDIGGRTYTGHTLTPAQVARYRDAPTRRGASPLTLRVAEWTMLRCAFQWRFSYLLRGDPVKLILGMPLSSRAQCIEEVLSHVHAS